MSFPNKNLYNGNALDGDLEIGGQLIVTGAATFNGGATVSGSLTPDSLTVDDTTLDNNTITTTATNNFTLNPGGSIVCSSTLTGGGTWSINTSGVGQGFTQLNCDNLLLDSSKLSSTGKLEFQAVTQIDFQSDCDLSDNVLRLRQDANHGLQWAGTTQTFASLAPDGACLYGFGGGVLGTKNGATEAVLLSWNGNGVDVGGSQLPLPGRKFTVTGESRFDNVRVTGNTVTTSTGDLALAANPGSKIDVSANSIGRTGFWDVNTSGEALFSQITGDKVIIGGANDSLISTTTGDLELNSATSMVSVKTNMELNDNPLYFRSDTNHYAKHSSSWGGIAVDGPVLAGFDHVVLGTTNGVDNPIAILSDNGMAIKTGAVPAAGRDFTVAGASVLANVNISTSEIDTTSGNLLINANSGAGNVTLTSANFSIDSLGAANFTELTVDNISLNGATIVPTGGVDLNVGSGTTNVALTSASYSINTSGVGTFTQVAVDNLLLDGNTVSTTSGNMTLNPTSNLVVTGNNFDLDATGNIDLGNSLMVNQGGTAPVTDNYSALHIKSNINDGGGAATNCSLTYEGNGQRLASVWAQKVAGGHGNINVTLSNSSTSYDMFNFHHDAELRLTNTGGTTCAYLVNGVVPSAGSYRINSSDRSTNYLDLNANTSGEVTLDSSGGRIKINDDFETDGKKIFTANSQTLTANGQTISTSKSLIWVSSASPYTGTILGTGTRDGQTVRVVYTSTSNNISWDATDSTSNVSNGTSNTINAGEGRTFVWNGTTSLWYALN